MDTKTTTPVNPAPKGLRHLTCSSSPAGKSQLRITGKWLEQAGFPIGSIVSVEVKRNCLIINKLPLKWRYEHHVRRYAVDSRGTEVDLK